MGVPVHSSGNREQPSPDSRHAREHRVHYRNLDLRHPVRRAGRTGPTVELLHEAHYTDQGVEIDVYVTRDADGSKLSEATLRDADSGDTEVDVWTDGVTVWWSGTVNGEKVHGSAAAVDFGEDPQEAGFCFTPVTALLCLGAAVVLIGSEGCAHTTWCTRRDPTEYPGGGGPGEGGGGDGEGDGSGSTGDDED